jgi:hypothetical protein
MMKRVPLRMSMPPWTNEPYDMDTIDRWSSESEIFQVAKLAKQRGACTMKRVKTYRMQQELSLLKSNDSTSGIGEVGTFRFKEKEYEKAIPNSGTCPLSDLKNYSTYPPPSYSSL